MPILTTIEVEGGTVLLLVEIPLREVVQELISWSTERSNGDGVLKGRE